MSVRRCLKLWYTDAAARFRAHGYFLFVTLIGAYFGLYAVFEARHERRANRAAFERAAFMTMVSSGNRGAFVAAMKDFGLIQGIPATCEPELWPPFAGRSVWIRLRINPLRRRWLQVKICKWWWSSGYSPNGEPLWRWAKHFLPLCTSDGKLCGDPNRKPPWRLDLAGANLRGAGLAGIDLHEAVLGGANLEVATLHWADLRGALLVGANLEGANLGGANLERANLVRAELRLANLEGANLRGAFLQSVWNWRKIRDIALANILGVQDPPDGFRHWALCRGAVEIEDRREWQAIRDGETPPPPKPTNCPKD
jgi:hypothetical protein